MSVGGQCVLLSIITHRYCMRHANGTDWNVVEFQLENNPTLNRIWRPRISYNLGAV